MYTQKLAIIFDHMAFDHRRLIRPGKKIRQNFLRLTSLLYKILPTNLGTCKWTFYIINFIHHTWGETVLWGTVFVIQTSDRMQCFTILQYKLLSFNIQDDWSTHGLLGKLLKKIDLVTVFDAILTSKQAREKLQWLYENIMSNNFLRTAVLKKIWLVN